MLLAGGFTGGVTADFSWLAGARLPNWVRVTGTPNTAPGAQPGRVALPVLAGSASVFATEFDGKDPLTDISQVTVQIVRTQGAVGALNWAVQPPAANNKTDEIKLTWNPATMAVGANVQLRVTDSFNSAWGIVALVFQ